MGFGTDPLGAGPAGMDLPASTEQRAAARPTALAFDGLTRNFILDENGRYKAAHPIDAKYFQRLRTAAGSIRSAPNTGQGVGSLQYIDPRTIDSFVRDQVNLVSEDMIAAREITVHNIEVDRSVPGRVQFLVDYTNLHTRKRQTV